MKIASLEYKFKGCFILEENCNLNHNVIIEGRCKLNISGVNEVLSFDDETIVVSSLSGGITVKGEGLKIIGFNTTSGDLSVSGKILAVVYTSEEKTNTGLFSKLFR